MGFKIILKKIKTRKELGLSSIFYQRNMDVSPSLNGDDKILTKIQEYFMNLTKKRMEKLRKMQNPSNNGSR